MMYTILAVPSVLFWILTLLPLSKYEAWWVRIWDFPRLQLAVVLLSLSAAQAALLPLDAWSSWCLLAPTVCALAYQLWWILPYTWCFRREVKSGGSGEPLGLMAANVLTTNRNADRLLELVRDRRPDILVTLETDRWWEERLDTLLPEYPHTIKCPLENLYGMHVYSRLPLRDAEIRYLVEPDVPSMHAEVVMPSGQGIRVHFLHPAPPSPTENEESTERDVELLMVAKSLEGHHGPVIVTGDLNDVAWSATTRLFRKASGLLDPRVGRGMYNTYHAEHWFMRWPLDHIFHSAHFTLRHIERLPYFGSDHFPVLITLCLQEAPKEQQGLVADEKDKERVEETLDENDADPDDVPAPDAGAAVRSSV